MTTYRPIRKVSKAQAVKERPILFSGPMVRAILSGAKTQTRRIGKCQLDDATELGVESALHATKGTIYQATYRAYPNGGTARWAICEFPYGVIGDHLWVREEHYRFGHWEQFLGVKTKTGRTKWKFIAADDEVLFDAPETFRKGRHHKDPYTKAWHKRLARFMPRKFSRITLEIVSVKVERLNEISDSDALAEGVTIQQDAKITSHYLKGEHTPAQLEYFALWESINGKGSWAANPFVWAITFRKL